MLELKRCACVFSLLLAGCGPSPELPPDVPEPEPRVVLRVSFTTLEVIDDKEEGSGDWRVVLMVDGTALGEPIKGEANAGESVALERQATSEGLEEAHKLVITVKVEEWDGGFDNSWEFIGEETRTLGKAEGFGIGGGHFELETDEGHVLLHYVIVRK